jgi:YD repeat-containing protein
MALYPEVVKASAPPKILGELSYQKLLPHKLTDRTSLLVNADNGNLVLQSQDFHINGIGPGLSITRYYNGLSEEAGQIGSRDSLSIGADVHITPNADGSATYQGPSGFHVTYQPDGNGSYKPSPAYTRARLAHTTNGWKLTFNHSGEVYSFDINGNQIKDTSKNGEAIKYSYDAGGHLTKATDSQGRVTTFGKYHGNSIGKITGPTGRTILYKYNTSRQLTRVTEPNGTKWSYSYDNSGNLAKITDPKSHTTSLSYDGYDRVVGITYGSANGPHGYLALHVSERPNQRLRSAESRNHLQI